MAKGIEDDRFDKEMLAHLEFGANFRARPRRRCFSRCRKKVPFEECKKENLAALAMKDRVIRALEDQLKRERESKQELRVRLLKRPSAVSLGEDVQENGAFSEGLIPSINSLSDALLLKVLFYLGSVELVLSTQFVCKKWQRVSWRAFTRQVMRFRKSGANTKVLSHSFSHLS